MKSTLIRSLALVCFAVLVLSTGFAVEPSKVIDLWPGIAPGEKGDLGEEKDTTKPTDQIIAGKRVIRLGNISKPTISFYRPPPDKDTGATVLLCPGGGYHILAMDLEGTEVCEWLNSIGVTAVKYRVPKREGSSGTPRRCRTRNAHSACSARARKNSASTRNESARSVSPLAGI